MTLFVILGPTGVGKSALCLEVAKHLGVPIINADSRQMYKELSIGTAAPTKEDLMQVKHYFVGNLSVCDYFSASMFEAEVLRLIESKEVVADFQGKQCALLSGGSMMYIDAVCKGIDDIPTVSPEVRVMLLERYEKEGLDKLRSELRLRDPEYYNIVDLKNPKRIIHALEVCYQSGKTYTSFRTNTARKRPFNIVKIGLNRDRQELYDRINQRVLAMIESGMEQEARDVYKYRKENSLNTVGYKELFEYFDGNLTLEEAIERIQANTRKYARKQLTWYRKDESIIWFHPEEKKQIFEYIDSI